ncbi:hypothetical protein WKI68_15700 [Streptomyces sp. MS1.HAVA.3]|uniref:Uncharacterized protein n=1 Tax=Streptomyces caledonius TaxID=3134107 RepID=A0ABU8U3L5_9ACTN
MSLQVSLREAALKIELEIFGIDPWKRRNSGDVAAEVGTFQA